MHAGTNSRMLKDTLIIFLFDQKWAGRTDELSDFFNADSDTVFFGETANPTLHLLLLNTGNLL